MKIIKNYWIIFLIGLILRLLIAGFTFHPDVKAPALAGAVFLREGKLNPYEFSKILSTNEILDDLPLSYFISLPFYTVGRLLVDSNTERIFFIDHSLLFGKPLFWLYLAYAKLPLIIFDLALAFTLLQLVSLQFQRKVFIIWMFNPMTLWATAAIGQMDIYPTFFIVLALYFLKRRKLKLAALSLGFGGAIKAAPFLLLPFLLGVSNKWVNRLKLIFIAVIPYFISVIPYLSSSEFRQNALIAPQLGKILFAQIPISGGEMVLIVPALSLLIYYIYFRKPRSEQDFIKYSLALLLIVLTFTHFHLQWFLWLTPFLIIQVWENWKDVKLAFLGIILSLVIMLFMFDPSLQIKLFAPIVPSLDKSAGFVDMMTAQSITFVRSLAASIFAASAFFLIWRIFSPKE